jgi:glutamyl-tRNA synthetase
MAKCTWFNAQYLRELSPDALLGAASPFLQSAGIDTGSNAHAAAAVHSVKEKVSLLSEIPAWVHYFFREDYPFEEEVITKLKAKTENKALLQAVLDHLPSISDWSESGFTIGIESVAAENKVKPGSILPLLRFSLSGQNRGPNVATIAHLIGQESTANRIRRVLTEVL